MPTKGVGWYLLNEIGSLFFQPQPDAPWFRIRYRACELFVLFIKRWVFNNFKCYTFRLSVIASATLLKWHSDDKDCMGRIMEATCYYHFPICPPPGEVGVGAGLTETAARRRLCHEDCQFITEGECSEIYNRLLQDTQSQGISNSIVFSSSTHLVSK